MELDQLKDMLNEDPYKYAIVNGLVYEFDKSEPIKNKKKYELGYEGCRFRIEFNNGDTYVTNDLWNIGNFRGKIEDNATKSLA